MSFRTYESWLELGLSLLGSGIFFGIALIRPRCDSDRWYFAPGLAMLTLARNALRPEDATLWTAGSFAVCALFALALRLGSVKTE